MEGMAKFFKLRIQRKIKTALGSVFYGMILYLLAGNFSTSNKRLSGRILENMEDGRKRNKPIKCPEE